MQKNPIPNRATPARPRLDLTRFMVVGCFLLIGSVVYLGVLAVIAYHVGSIAALIATLANVLLMVLLGTLVALFTEFVDAKAAVQLLGKILGKIPLLQNATPTKRAENAEP